MNTQEIATGYPLKTRTSFKQVSPVLDCSVSIVTFLGLLFVLTDDEAILLELVIVRLGFLLELERVELEAADKFKLKFEFELKLDKIEGDELTF